MKRATATLTSQETSVSPLSVKPNKFGARGVWRALVAFFAATLMVLSLTPGVIQQNTPPQAHALDVTKWLMCGYGKDSIPGKLYQYSQSSDLQFEAYSKSASTVGQSSPDTGANGLLKIVGVDLDKNNQQLVMGGTDVSSSEGYNKGAKLNFFDRFGLGGYQFTAYTGEWNHLVIDACGDKPQPQDPKANHYYDTRLDPTATWDKISSSQDPRVKIFANGQGARYASSVGTFVGNIALGATTWVVGLFLTLLILSFKDVGKLIGLTDILVGTNPDKAGGILGELYQGLFFALFLVVFLGGLIYTFYKLAERKGKIISRDWKAIIIPTIAALVAVTTINFAGTLLPIPNRVASFVQSITIKATTQQLGSFGEWCSTEVGEKKSTYNAESQDGGKKDKDLAEDINQIVSENYGNIVASELSCTFTKLFIFDPWVQGQFGTSPNNLWAEGKDIPSWAKDGKTAGNSNSKWVGDASVPMGGNTTLNNWALYQLSTQTTEHLPTGSETDLKARTAQGVATDWWRVVDAMSNYNEKNVDLKIPQASELPSNVSNGKWARPAEAVMTSPYGNRPEIGDVHKGIDFGAQCGAPIYAAGDGKVVFAQKASDGANGVIIQHDGVSTMYWHMQDGSLKVKVGDTVSAGQQIGSSGDTGFAFGCHLHFEVRPGTDWGNPNNVTDPQPWFKERNIDVTKEGDGLTPQAAVASDSSGRKSIEITRGEQDFESKPLAVWNTWTGASSGSRLAAGLSALVVSIIALAVPLVLAILTAITTISLQLLILVVPFAALAVMTGSDIGIGFAKRYGVMATKLFLARVALGLLLTLSVVFTLWAYSIMEKVGWWQGVLVLALLSAALWAFKNRILALAETYAGGLIRIPNRILGNVGTFGKRMTGIGTASMVSGLSAKQAGGSFFKGAHNAGSDKMRDALNSTRAGRAAMSVAVRPVKTIPDILKKPEGHTAKIDEPIKIRCASCGKVYKHGEIRMYTNEQNGLMYCDTCKKHGLVPNADILKAVKTKADARRGKKRLKPARDTYVNMALKKPELQKEAVKDEASAYAAYNTLMVAVADTLSRQDRTVKDHMQPAVVSYELPEQLKKYFNVEAYNMVRDADDMEKMRRHWGQAIHRFILEEFGYTINRTPEETINDMRRNSDGYSAWWDLDPNAKREKEEDKKQDEKEDQEEAEKPKKRRLWRRKNKEENA